MPRPCRPPPPDVAGQHQQQRDHEHRGADDVDLRRDAPLGGAPHVHRERDGVPELKFVMMKSSNDSENASSAAATMPGQHQRQRDPAERLPLAGVQVHRRLLQPRVHPGQPRLDRDHHERHAEHHVRDDDRSRSRAARRRRRTAPAATCPSPAPGVAIGRKISRFVADRPRKRCRTSANAISVPRMVATTRGDEPDLRRCAPPRRTCRPAPHGSVQLSRVNCVEVVRQPARRLVERQRDHHGDRQEQVAEHQQRRRPSPSGRRASARRVHLRPPRPCRPGGRRRRPAPGSSPSA